MSTRHQPCGDEDTVRRPIGSVWRIGQYEEAADWPGGVPPRCRATLTTGLRELSSWQTPGDWPTTLNAAAGRSLWPGILGLDKTAFLKVATPRRSVAGVVDGRPTGGGRALLSTRWGLPRHAGGSWLAHLRHNWPSWERCPALAPFHRLGRVLSAALAPVFQ